MLFQHVLVATDFSECSKRALDLAVELAQKLDAQLTVTHVWEVPAYGYGPGMYVPGDFLAPIEGAAQARLNEALDALKQRFPSAKGVLRTGAPWDEILAAALSVHADLIVIGTHGRRGLSRALMGSVAERVVRLSTVPVLTVHGS
ncbi:MAG: universal stress protein [Polyangiaceae bacterium]